MRSELDETHNLTTPRREKEAAPLKAGAALYME